MADAYLDQGKPAEAQAPCDEALPIIQKALGEEHPYTLMVMRNLARAHLGQGNPAEAQKLYEEVVPIMRQVLPPEHPDTLEAIRELESIRRKQESMEDTRGSSPNSNP